MFWVCIMNAKRKLLIKISIIVIISLIEPIGHLMSHSSPAEHDHIEHEIKERKKENTTHLPMK